VFDLGRELYDRLAGLGGHVAELGKSLSGAVAAYNRSVGTLESRVMVSARRLHALGVTDADLPAPAPVEAAPRPLSAAELTGQAPPGLAAVVTPLSASGPVVGSTAPDSACRAEQGQSQGQVTASRPGDSRMMGAAS
jgi:DNA recombination protein RmuC